MGMSLRVSVLVRKSLHRATSLLQNILQSILFAHLSLLSACFKVWQASQYRNTASSGCKEKSVLYSYGTNKLK